MLTGEPAKNIFLTEEPLIGEGAYNNDLSQKVGFGSDATVDNIQRKNNVIMYEAKKKFKNKFPEEREDCKR